MLRIESIDGRVIFWNGPCVLGVLTMSRAIGDKYLKLSSKFHSKIAQAYYGRGTKLIKRGNVATCQDLLFITRIQTANELPLHSIKQMGEWAVGKTVRGPRKVSRQQDSMNKIKFKKNAVNCQKHKKLYFV